MSRFFEIGNVDLNDLVYNTLSINNDDHVLEVGFGPGTLIKKIADGLNYGLIEGIDLSDAMVTIAEKKNRKHIRNGKVKLHHGNIDTISLMEKSYDKIYAVNTIYFWKEPKETVSKISGLLKPSGVFYIGFFEKTGEESSLIDPIYFNHYTIDELRLLMADHGSFENIDTVSKEIESGICHCIFGTR